jgi:hypothetical protein
MDIERVRIVKTLKAGPKLWKEGDIIAKPIPSELIAEIREETGAVEVLGGDTDQETIDDAVAVKKAQLEAASVNKIADLEIAHYEEVRKFEDRIKILETNLANMTKRAEAAEKKKGKGRKR